MFTVFLSVYTLWRNPKLVPLLHTTDFVLQKLRTGADLMTPGLARGPPFPSKATKNAIVAVASIEKPSVPRVVGECDINVASLGKVQGTKGHAVRGHHWDGDEIWTWSQSGKPGILPPDEIEGWDLDSETTVLGKRLGDLSMDEQEQDGGVSLDTEVNQPSNHSPYTYLDGESAPPYEGEGAGKSEMTSQGESNLCQIQGVLFMNSQAEIDDAFLNAFLYGVHTHVYKNKGDPHRTLNFPIPQSLLISNFVLPYLPIWTPTDSSALQIKKTSWKNAKRFIKALVKQKLIKSKDRDGGETVVVDIEFKSLAIINFVPYKLPQKDIVGADTVGSGGGSGGNASVTGNSYGDESVGQQLTKLNLFRAKEQLSEIFEASNSSVKQLYLATELRSIILSYINSENLVSATNNRLVNLNPILANAVFNGQSSIDGEVLAKGSVPREALIQRILESCSPFWAILRNEETRESIKAKAGHRPKIQLTYETRSGNKTVTKISGVEVFHINPQLLADELQKACASSTSVNQLMGSSPKNPVQEILVQGPQKDAVFKALEKRGINKQWIEVVNKTKGKNKHQLGKGEGG